MKVAWMVAHCGSGALARRRGELPAVCKVIPTASCRGRLLRLLGRGQAEGHRPRRIGPNMSGIAGPLRGSQVAAVMSQDASLRSHLGSLQGGKVHSSDEPSVAGIGQLRLACMRDA